jgi:hypothetical protein
MLISNKTGHMLSDEELVHEEFKAFPPQNNMIIIL